MTSYARLHLYEKCFEKAVSKGGQIYYCDTDSVVTDVKLDIGDNLGDLTDEMPQGIQEAIFLLPKMYAINTCSGDLIKCKGFPKKLFEYNIFKTALDNDDYSGFTFVRDQIATPFESMRRNKTFVSMIRKTRTVQQRYDKRIIISDGINTIPYIINDSGVCPA